MPHSWQTLVHMCSDAHANTHQLLVRGLKALLVTLASRFRPAKAREMIAAVLSSRLAGCVYNPDKMSVVSKEIADEIKQRLKGGLVVPASTCIPPTCMGACCHLTASITKLLLADAGWQRYKYAVQVLIGEQRGEGCR